METPSELISFSIFRPVGGIRTPHIMTLDRGRNVVSEVIDYEELGRIKSSPHRLARHTVDTAENAEERQAATLQRGGLYKHITDKGITISREPPDGWALKFDDWRDPAHPNPFAGTDELRAAYLVERSVIMAEIDAGNCAGCEMNRVDVSYRNQLRKQLGL